MNFFLLIFINLNYWKICHWRCDWKAYLNKDLRFCILGFSRRLMFTLHLKNKSLYFFALPNQKIIKLINELFKVILFVCLVSNMLYWTHKILIIKCTILEKIYQTFTSALSWHWFAWTLIYDLTSNCFT